MITKNWLYCVVFFIASTFLFDWRFIISIVATLHLLRKISHDTKFSLTFIHVLSAKPLQSNQTTTLVASPSIFSNSNESPCTSLSLHLPLSHPYSYIRKATRIEDTADTIHKFHRRWSPLPHWQQQSRLSLRRPACGVVQGGQRCRVAASPRGQTVRQIVRPETSLLSHSPMPPFVSPHLLWSPCTLPLPRSNRLVLGQGREAASLGTGEERRPLGWICFQANPSSASCAPTTRGGGGTASGADTRRCSSFGRLRPSQHDRRRPF